MNRNLIFHNRTFVIYVTGTLRAADTASIDARLFQVMKPFSPRQDVRGGFLVRSWSRFWRLSSSSRDRIKEH